MTDTFLKPLELNEKEQPQEMLNNQLTLPDKANTASPLTASQTLKPGQSDLTVEISMFNYNSN